MWKSININLKGYLYFEKIRLNNGIQEFIFLDDSDKLFKVIINGLSYAFRATNDTLYLSNCDKYTTSKDKKILGDYLICYTFQSEYLDWFNQARMNSFSKSELYHFFIKSENYIIEFITDEIPTFQYDDKAHADG